MTGSNEQGIDPDASGAPQPLPAQPAGARGLEPHEREAALRRGASLAGQSSTPLCAPPIADLEPGLLYTLVAHNVRDYAIFLMDPNGIIQCWGESARLMKWWTKEQAEGAHLRLLYPDGGAEDGTAESHLANAAETGEYNGEGHRVRSDGTTFWAYVTLTALRNLEGKLVGFTKVTRDFTARRAVEAALKRDQQIAPDSQHMLQEASRLRRIMANLSHELRNPLNAIVGSISLLKREKGIDDHERSHVDRLQRNSAHLLALVDDVPRCRGRRPDSCRSRDRCSALAPRSRKPLPTSRHRPRSAIRR